MSQQDEQNRMLQYLNRRAFDAQYRRADDQWLRAFGIQQSSPIYPYASFHVPQDQPDPSPESIELPDYLEKALLRGMVMADLENQEFEMERRK